MADRPRYYVSLGDTGSADDNGDNRADDLLYQNQDEAFPEWAGRDLSTRVPAARLLSLTVEGAASAGVRYSQLPRLADLGISPDLITIHLGANDLLPCFGDEEALRNATEAFVVNIGVILRQARRAAVVRAPVLINAMPIYEGDATAAWALRSNKALREIAAEARVIVVDLPVPSAGASIREAWWNTLAKIGFV